MPRTDGKKIVALAFGATTLAIGIGQIYLPYIADRDKLRGLFEEEDMPAQARREMETMLKQEAQAQGKSSGGSSGTGSIGEGGSNTNGGSMWKNLRRN
jgi:hypothetical protein